ncbi:MAG: hypothetical protein H6531_05255 [Actinobacteria bacterium]|nr:hypothetical protein [Actinomycetota bacterium]
MRRRKLVTMLAVPMFAVGLLVAGCDDDESAADQTTLSAPAPLAPASIAADDQAGDGRSVTVARLTLPAPGFIVIHADGGGAPGPVIGHSDLLPAGDSNDVEVALDTPITSSATVWPMAHVDVNVNEAYEFAPPDEATDAPALQEEAGAVAVVPIEYSVE